MKPFELLEVAIVITLEPASQRSDDSRGLSRAETRLITPLTEIKTANGPKMPAVIPEALLKPNRAVKT
jgi:hypothetical protein